MGSGLSTLKDYDDKPKNNENNNNNVNNQFNEKQKIKNLMKGLFGMHLLNCNRCFRMASIEILPEIINKMGIFANQCGFPNLRNQLSDENKYAKEFINFNQMWYADVYTDTIDNTTLSTQILNELLQETYQELPTFLAQVLKQNYQSISLSYDKNTSRKVIINELLSVFQSTLTDVVSKRDQSKYLGYAPHNKYANSLFVEKIKEILSDKTVKLILLMRNRKDNIFSMLPKNIALGVAAMAEDLIDSIDEVSSLKK